MNENRTNSDNPVGNSSSSLSGSYLGCSIPPDPQLIAEGWQRRFIGDARMARDAVDSYTELGFEVKLESLDPGQLKDDCSGCKVIYAFFRAVYTRKAN